MSFDRNVLRMPIAIFGFTIFSMMLRAENAKILVVETIACQSHWNFMNGVIRALTDVGHQVTAFTPFPEGDRPNYTEVDTSKEFPLVKGGDLMFLLEKRSHPFLFLNVITGWSRYLCNVVHANGQLKKILSNNAEDRFDIIIVEPNTLDCMSYSARALNIPIIYIIPTPIISYTERAFIGHMPNPAIVSNILARHAVPKTFAQRLANTAILAYGTFITGIDEWLLRFIDPKPYDLSINVRPSVVFQNSHYLVDAPRSNTQNLVDIGGIHLRTPNSIPKVSYKYFKRQHRHCHRDIEN